MKKIFVVDNYDSFTYNLVHILHQLVGKENVVVKRNDKFELDTIEEFDAILLSPGPGVPSEAGLMPEVIQRFAPHKKILGVCLGHQAIGEAFGAKLTNMPTVLHGQASQLSVLEANKGLFRNIPVHFQIAHYHSWVVSDENLPSSLVVTARCPRSLIMAVRHQKYDVCGVQFHPESVMTEYGVKLIENWLLA